MSIRTIIETALPGKFCFTCGEVKDPRDFNRDPAQHDGLGAECARCHEAREMARRMDGEVGPRQYAIEGEGRKRAPFAPELTMRAVALAQNLRRRPTSGLVPAWSGS